MVKVRVKSGVSGRLVSDPCRTAQCQVQLVQAPPPETLSCAGLEVYLPHLLESSVLPSPPCPLHGHARVTKAAPLEQNVLYTDGLQALGRICGSE